MRKPFKILLLVLLVLVLVVGGYVIYVFASYDRIEDNLRRWRSTGRSKPRRRASFRLHRHHSRKGCADTDWRDAFTHFMEHRLRCLHRRL